MIHINYNLKDKKKKLNLEKKKMFTQQRGLLLYLYIINFKVIFIYLCTIYYRVRTHIT